MSCANRHALTLSQFEFGLHDDVLVHDDVWAITSKKPWAIPIIDKSQFLQAISVSDKLSSINFSDKCCGKFLICLTKFFL